MSAPGPWTTYRLAKGERTLATARWRSVEDSPGERIAELHSVVHDPSPGVLRRVRGFLFDAIKADVRKAGLRFMAVSGTPEAMAAGLARFSTWAGFTLLDDLIDGKRIAMMEVE